MTLLSYDRPRAPNGSRKPCAIPDLLPLIYKRRPAHGAGIAPRAAAAAATVLMLEIVIAVAVTGQSPTALRDVGVLGLAVCLTGVRHQRLVLRN